MSGDLQISFSFGSNSHDTSLARERTRNVEIAIGVEGQAWRTSDAAIEHGNSAVRINLIYPIKARGRGPCNEEVSLGSKCQVVGRNTWLERSKYKRLAITRDLKNCAATVTHVKILLAVKSDTRRDSHAFRIGGHRSIRRDTIHRALNFTELHSRAAQLNWPKTASTDADLRPR